MHSHPAVTASTVAAPARPSGPSHRAAKAGARSKPLGALAAALVTGLAAITAPAQAADKILYQSRSSFNTLIVNEDEKGLRVLRFEPDGARQSVVKLGDPDHIEVMYAKAIPVVLAYVPEPRRVLVVGLGGGTIPMFLRKRLPEIDIDVVELDPAVVSVAKSHFGFREDARLHAHVADGRRFIEKKRSDYDLIILDAFGANEVPFALATREFQRSVRRALTPRGIVVANLWAGLSNPLFPAMVRTYIDTYPQVAVLDLEGVANRLVIAGPWSPLPDTTEIVRRSREISTRLELRTELAPIIERGLRAPGPDEAGATALSDSRPPRPAR